MGTALAMLLTAPFGAMAQDLDKSFEEGVEVSFENTVAVVVAKTLDGTTDIDFAGTIVITGEIPISAAALVTIDNQQVNDDGIVSIFGSDTQVSNAIGIGPDVLQASGGNLGLNLSTGDSILQHNAVTIASEGAPSAEGASAAEVFSMQSSINTVVNGGDPNGAVTNQVALLGAVLESATGNIGVNAATGAFHIQNNALALASTSANANLASALASVVQQASFAQVVHSRVTNSVTLGQGVLANAIGNIGINLTAGTNNIQQNTLVISTGE